MKIVERYVFSAFLSAFFLAWLVLSFVLSVGLLVRITRFLIEGLPIRAVGLLLLIGLPETLTLTVPLSLLVSALLVFSRLSADSEIAAMRACGINLLQIMKWPFLAGALFTLLGVYVNHEIAPRSHEVRRNLKAMISVDAGLELLEPGRMIDEFPGVTVFFEKKSGNWLYDLLIFDYTREEVTREIRASRALISTNASDIVLDLFNVRVDPVEDDRPGVAVADRLRHVIPDALTRRPYRRREKDYRFFELRNAIADLRANLAGLPRDRRRVLLSIHRTQFHMRLVYACASLSFVLIGVPLGIRTHRKESTLGMAASLAVSMMYYLFVILAESFDKVPAVQPYALVWLPVVICGALALILIPRNL